MTIVLLLTFAIMLMAVTGMALGAIVSGRRLKGSCGGVGPGAEGDCLCAREGRPRKCERGGELSRPPEPPLAQLPSRSEERGAGA